MSMRNLLLLKDDRGGGNGLFTDYFCYFVHVSYSWSKTYGILLAVFYAPPIRPRLMALYKCALID